MNRDGYVEERLEDQIRWYDGRSQYNRRWYKVLRSVEVIAAASIPFLAGYLTQVVTFTRVAVGMLGLVVAVIAGLLSIHRFYELWIEYRTTCESLKHEKYMFLTGTEPYNTQDPFALLVQRVETLISREHGEWARCVREEKPESRND